MDNMKLHNNKDLMKSIHPSGFVEWMSRIMVKDAVVNTVGDCC